MTTTRIPHDRIAILYVQPYATEINGVDVVLLSLIRELDPKRYRIEALFSGKSPYTAQYEALGVKCHYGHIPVFGKPKSVMYLLRNIMAVIPGVLHAYRIIRVSEIDILHIHKLETFVTSLAGRMADIPVVHTIHEVPGRPLAFYRLIGTLARVFANRIIVLCDFSMGIFGSDTRKTCKIYNGIRFNIAPRTNYGSGDTSRRQVNILSVGRITPMKGQSVLVDAVSILKDRGYDNLRLQIAGAPVSNADIAYQEEIYQRIREKNLQSMVDMLGKRNDIPELLVSADLFVLPSVYDVWPTTLLEAACAATPTVATAVGGVKEMVAHFATLAEPNDPSSLADAIESCLTNWESSCELARQWSSWAKERFSIEQYVNGTTSVYNELFLSPGYVGGAG